MGRGGRGGFNPRGSRPPGPPHQQGPPPGNQGPPPGFPGKPKNLNPAADLTTTSIEGMAPLECTETSLRGLGTFVL